MRFDFESREAVKIMVTMTELSLLTVIFSSRTVVIMKVDKLEPYIPIFFHKIFSSQCFAVLLQCQQSKLRILVFYRNVSSIFQFFLINISLEQ